jgi:hypothetical protein
MKESKDDNPWTTLSSKPVYENPWILVEEHQVINPAGGKGIYGKVHFKNKAIGIVALDDQKNTWLVGQFRYPLNEWSWEIPEGGGPIGADVLLSAKRELKEETECICRILCPTKKRLYFWLKDSKPAKPLSKKQKRI